MRKTDRERYEKIQQKKEEENYLETLFEMEESAHAFAVIEYVSLMV